ncbi:MULTISPECIES: cytochrome-c peroxidase [unclassified Schlesneria]|uniref:cytochrome-c peroxidase n=1 Tax=unclassified Schlesneria TaxID=2762017 RepID=UPI002F0C7A89
MFRHLRPIRVVCGIAVLVWGLSDWIARILPAQETVSARETMNEASKVFAPLPKSDSNRLEGVAAEQVALGQKLFFDPRISSDGVRSCMICHQPALYGTDGLPVSRGAENKPFVRNAPTVLNSALQFRIHWDGRFPSVEEQAGAALLGPGFHNPSDEVVISRLDAIPGYIDLFRNAFPDDKSPVTRANWGRAIGAYERTLVTPARFDDFLKGDENALNAPQLRGLRLFQKSGCADCHSGALLGGISYEKFGITSDYWSETKSPAIDKGRFTLTNKEEDLYVFKVPPLRNVAMTPPYFHDGSVRSLPEAVQIMARVQLGITLKSEEVQDIVSFLDSLTGTLPSNFTTAPQLPPAAFLTLP